MKHVFAVIFMLMGAALHAQQSSFFIVASGADGIMVATDARAPVMNNARTTTYGYHDFANKTFIIGNVAMIALGTDVFSGQYLNSIFEEYKKSVDRLPTVSEVLPQFFSFCSKKLSAKDYQLLSQNRFLVCGYEKNIPTMCMQDGSVSKRECVSEGWIRVASDGSDFETKYIYTLTCQQLGKLAEQSINKFAADNQRRDIGGPIRVLKLTAGNIQWLQNKPPQQWSSLQDFYKDYIPGKAVITFSPASNKAKFDAMLKKDFPQVF